MRRNGARPVWSGGKDRGVKTRVLPITIIGAGSCSHLQKNAGIHRHPRLPPRPAHRPGPSKGIGAESHPSGIIQARSAERDARGLASNLQNSLDGTCYCGRAPKGGTLSAAAGLRPANFRAPSEKTPAFGRNLPERANSRPSGFSLLDRARPVFSFRRNRKEKMGGALPSHHHG